MLDPGRSRIGRMGDTDLGPRRAVRLRQLLAGRACHAACIRRPGGAPALHRRWSTVTDACNGVLAARACHAARIRGPGGAPALHPRCSTGRTPPMGRCKPPVVRRDDREVATPLQRSAAPCGTCQWRSPRKAGAPSSFGGATAVGHLRCRQFCGGVLCRSNRQLRYSSCGAVPSRMVP